MLVSWPAIRNSTDGERVHIYSHNLDASSTVLCLVPGEGSLPGSPQYAPLCLLFSGGRGGKNEGAGIFWKDAELTGPACHDFISSF